ncbi:MAG TPA: hypothetical protein PLB87_10710 [Prolixibacteraceae bacterium]|nr:hypothetical protein [Prolixibacteraceae bacterium]
MKRFIIILSLVVVAGFFSCDETILRNDCNDQENIELKLEAEYSTNCDPKELLKARGASFLILRGGDTIYSGNLDGNGRFDTGPIDHSNCGMNNVVVEASFQGKSVREEFGLLCCDTLLHYVFRNISCDNQPDTVDCAAIDTTIVKTITSSGECVMQDATIDEMRNNSVIIASSSPVRIELNELLALDGKIYLQSINPAPVNKQVILENNQLEIYFNVERTDTGKISPVTINLPTYCLDSLGNDVSSGLIKIIVDASVCKSDLCSCPFTGSDQPETFYASEGVMLGENKTFDFVVAELSKGMLGDHCLLAIDSITRDDGSSAYLSIGHSWTIQSFSPSNMSNGDQLKVSANFAPPKSGQLAEDFIAYTSVYSDNDLTKRQNNSACSFKFRLKGESCEINCPEILILGANVKQVDKNSLTEKTLFAGTKLDFQDDQIIRQKISAIMSNKCLKKQGEKPSALFNLSLPDGYYCDDIRLSVKEYAIGPFDDRGRFYSATLPGAMNENKESSVLTITFDTPDLSDYYNSNHDSIYQCGFNIVVTDQEGKEICRQDIQVVSEVYEFSLRSGDVIPMEAFSQVSATASVPSYHVYDIDVFNKTLGNYGLRESLTPNFIDHTSVPNQPLSSHSLYFDVDHPDNPSVNYAEKPRLYLLNTKGNNFSKITATPVTTYPTPDAFFKAYEDGSLTDLIFSKADPDNFDWTPGWGKADGGLSINPYEVYVMWDPDMLPETYQVDGKKKRVYCGLAILYISSVKSGQDNTNSSTGGNGKASVSFYVEYPVKF